MELLNIPYNGQVYPFKMYTTTINKENIIFLITQDQEAARMMKDDHFFITMNTKDIEASYFNAIMGTEEEVKFKQRILEMVMMRHLIVQPKPSSN